MEISQRMSVALSLSFVGGVIPRRANFELNESDDARREQHNVQPLPETKQRHIDQDVPVPRPCARLSERVSEQFDLAFPGADLLLVLPRPGATVPSQAAGRMFRFTRKRLAGSYFFFIAARRW